MPIYTTDHHETSNIKFPFLVEKWTIHVLLDYVSLWHTILMSTTWIDYILHLL